MDELVSLTPPENRSQGTIDLLNRVIPDKASGLRNWIRPIAPDYAQKAGAPKK